MLHLMQTSSDLLCDFRVLRNVLVIEQLFAFPAVSFSSWTTWSMLSRLLAFAWNHPEANAAYTFNRKLTGCGDVSLQAFCCKGTSHKHSSNQLRVSQQGAANSTVDGRLGAQRCLCSPQSRSYTGAVCAYMHTCPLMSFNVWQRAAKAPLTALALYGNAGIAAGMLCMHNNLNRCATDIMTCVHSSQPADTVQTLL